MQLKNYLQTLDFDIGEDSIVLWHYKKGLFFGETYTEMDSIDDDFLNGRVVEFYARSEKGGIEYNFDLDVHIK